MPLDLYTLTFATVLNLLTTGGVMTMVWNAERRAPAVRLVGIGLLLAGLGQLLSLMRGDSIPALTGLALLLSATSVLRGFRLLPNTCNQPWPGISSLAAGLSVAARDKSTFLIPRSACAVYLLLMCSQSAWFFTLPHAPSLFQFASLIALNLLVTGCGFGLAIESEKRLRLQTEALAMYDPLTELPNRRMFEDCLEAARHRAIREGGRLAVIYGDLDGFKEINDSLGHHLGDVALQIVGGRLSRLVSQGIFAARIGGDEFVALVEKLPSRSAALEAMKALQDAVNGEVSLGGRLFPLSMSCGLSVFPDDAHSEADLVRRADTEMYRAKGRIRVQPELSSVAST